MIVMLLKYPSNNLMLQYYQHICIDTGKRMFSEEHKTAACIKNMYIYNVYLIYIYI